MGLKIGPLCRRLQHALPFSRAGLGRLTTLARNCEDLDRDPAEIESSVNVGFYMSVDGGEKELGSFSRFVAGSLVGSPQRAIDRLGEYERRGVQGVNIAFRPPIDWQAFEAFVEQVLPVFHRSLGK